MLATAMYTCISHIQHTGNYPVYLNFPHSACWPLPYILVFPTFSILASVLYICISHIQHVTTVWHFCFTNIQHPGHCVILLSSQYSAPGPLCHSLIIPIFSTLATMSFSYHPHIQHPGNYVILLSSLYSAPWPLCHSLIIRIFSTLVTVWFSYLPHIQHPGHCVILLSSHIQQPGHCVILLSSHIQHPGHCIILLSSPHSAPWPLWHSLIIPIFSTLVTVLFSYHPIFSSLATVLFSYLPNIQHPDHCVILLSSPHSAPWPLWHSLIFPIFSTLTIVSFSYPHIHHPGHCVILLSSPYSAAWPLLAFLFFPHSAPSYYLILLSFPYAAFWPLLHRLVFMTFLHAVHWPLSHTLLITLINPATTCPFHILHSCYCHTLYHLYTLTAWLVLHSYPPPTHSYIHLVPWPHYILVISIFNMPTSV